MSDKKKEKAIIKKITQLEGSLFNLKYAVETGYFGDTEESMALVEEEMKELSSRVSEWCKL